MPRGKKLRERLVGDAEVRVRLVVAEQDVVLGLVLLDEAVFEQQRVELGVNDGELQPHNLRHHAARFLVVASRLVEVARNPVFQVLGLADVNQVAGFVEVAVHAGLVGQVADLFF